MKTVECINVAREAGHAVLSMDGAEYSVNLDDLQKVLIDLYGEPTPRKASTELLRPSLLPKLAQCPCFVSSPDRADALLGAIWASIRGAAGVWTGEGNKPIVGKSQHAVTHTGKFCPI